MKDHAFCDSCLTLNSQFFHKLKINTNIIVLPPNKHRTQYSLYRGKHFLIFIFRSVIILRIMRDISTLTLGHYWNSNWHLNRYNSLTVPSTHVILATMFCITFSSTIHCVSVACAWCKYTTVMRLFSRHCTRISWIVCILRQEWIVQAVDSTVCSCVCWKQVLLFKVSFFLIITPVFQYFSFKWCILFDCFLQLALY